MFGAEDEDDGGTVYRDAVTLMFGIVTVCTVLLLSHINVKAEQSKDADSKAPGNVMVEVRWPDELDADVDTWVQAPGDIPVGYSNKGGVVFDLLRDDLGRFADVSGLNYEMAYARGVVPGEYTVNLHLYRDISGQLPITAKVIVSTKENDKAGVKQIIVTDATLYKVGQERTVVRFRLDEHGALVPGSMNNIQKPLRGGTKP